MEHLSEVLEHFTPYAQCITSLVVSIPINNRIISAKDFAYLVEDES
jgi:hypothetical protein